MDDKIKNSCPNCCQLYSLKILAAQPKSNIPLFIKCGHSMCEYCVRNIVKFGEPIECKICLQTMEIKTTDIAKLLQNKIQLYKLFPVNLSVLGELALELIAEKSKTEEDKEEEIFFIDLQAILDSTDQTQGQCLECHSKTTKMCQQCATVICEDCFNKSHKNFVVFQNHVLQNIELPATNNCKAHSQKSLEYYCKDCAKSICMDCLMVGSEKSCKNHNVVSAIEMNEMFISDLREIFPQVDTIFRRLTKTAVDIGHLLHNMENDSGSPELRLVTASIEQHFSKLYATVQAHKQEVMNNVARLRRIEKESLLRAREEVAGAIKESKQVMTALKSALDCEKNQSANLSALLEEAKSIVNKPWCLSKDETAKDTLKVCVSEELCLLVSDYVQLVGNAQARYALRASHEVPAAPPPPRAPVFPPALPRDVRFSKPTLAAEEVPPQKPESANGAPPFAPKGNARKSSPEIKKTAIQTVTPFAEKKPLIQLKAGVQEQAYITHMQDPHNFYVRRARDDHLLSEIENQLRESLGQVPPDVVVGSIYAVKHENSWKRGSVDGVEIAGYRVTFVDYGYVATVALDDLRVIPSELALGEDSRYPAPLALRCRLANCEPSAGTWCPGDTDLVRRMVNRAPVLLHVRSAGECSECDVTTGDGVSVAHALCFHTRAALVKQHLPYPDVEKLSPQRLPVANNGLRQKRSGDVIITHVITPGKFYVRESHYQADYVKLCEELNNAYNSRDESDFIYLPEPGMVCVVLVDSEDGYGQTGWARAQVTWRGAARAGVWLPDCGRQLAAPWHRLRAIDTRFTLLRPLAIEVHVAGVRPRGGRWSPAASELLARHAGRRCRLVVADARRRSLGAALLVLDADPPLCLNQEMVDRQFADPDRSIDFERLIAEHHSPRTAPSPQPSFNDENVTVDTPDTTMAKSDQEEFPADRRSSIRLEAKILHYESPSLIYISMMHQQKTFNELFEDIQKFYIKRKTPRRENWKVNDKCCAFCLQSETWRRATILETEKDEVTVFYTDFACTETVPISNLKKLHSDFEIIGDAAIKCHLAGVAPAAGDWPSLTKEFLKDKLEEYKRVFVTKVGQFVETSMPVELWVWHTEQGSALEPDASEWRCLNGELVRRGLAVPDLTQQIDTGSGESESDEETLRFLNVRGSVHSWLVPLPPGAGAGAGSDSSSSGPFVTDWLPPEPLSAAEFTAVPTYIDNEGVIYLHDVAQQDDLDFIRDTLEMAFKEADPKAPYCSWRVGEPCVARYYLDSHFYRGTVVQVNEEESNCLVQYVDYGNSELCTFEDLRKRVALHQIPIQAHKCSLSRIKPTGETWDLAVLDYVHKAIVEKKCFIKVVGPDVNGVTPVDLKYDKLWINDHLVEYGLAAYADGSKPIDRKYKTKKSKHSTSTSDKNKGKQVSHNDICEVINSSSEPDYIVEEFTDSSQASGTPDSFKIRTLVDHDSNENETHEQVVNQASANLVTYPQYEEREFDCNIPVINDTNSLELSIIRDAEVNSAYEELFEIVKRDGKNMPPLSGIYEYKPCIALFEDHWYRASILKYSEAKNLIKVHYVDYGNIGIVTLSDAREISKDWASFPPVCVTARLHGVRVNPDLQPDDVTKAYIDTFLDKGPFHAKIVNYDDSVPFVELRNNEGKLVYEKLIKDKVFLRDTCDKSISE